jgi:NitT/TauT family transport system ATP-binding protein
MSPEQLQTRQIFVHDLYKAYGEKLVLDNIDLAVTASTFCSVVGPSGCGKSTLFRILVGQEEATSGTVLFDGAPVVGPGTERGIVYQRYSLYPHLTVQSNVALARSLRVSPLQARAQRREFADEAVAMLERVQLAEHRHKYPHELSGGMQQRVAIAQALMAKPRVLMMDEPFGALDPETREAMQVLILQLWEQDQMTVFFVTHDMEEAVYLGTRILVLSQHYTDDRGAGARRGAKIVADYHLDTHAQSTEVKRTAAFLDLVGEIRRVGFDPTVLRHVDEFNLKHPDSFRTLTQSESRHRDAAA